MEISKKEWEAVLDKQWQIRLTYADWLEEHGHNPWDEFQRWMALNKKCPGPPCVLEADEHEVTWFIEDQAYTSWLGRNARRFVVQPEWCLPNEMFFRLDRYIVANRRSQFHQRFAKSYTSREYAEGALAATWIVWQAQHLR